MNFDLDRFFLTLWRVIYYFFAQFIPSHPFPGYQIGYGLRSFLCRKLLKQCGVNVKCRDRCYFGAGSRLVIGDGSSLGQGARLNGTITIGSDVIMGPDVIMMATSHAYDRKDLPIMAQGTAPEKPIKIGNNVWVGTRVIILPGVEIGDNTIIGAGAVVTKSFPKDCIIGGNPAKILKYRQ